MSRLLVDRRRLKLTCTMPEPVELGESNTGVIHLYRSVGTMAVCGRVRVDSLQRTKNPTYTIDAAHGYICVYCLAWAQKG